VSPADGHLYISNPEKHQVLRVLSLEAVTEPDINSEPVVGSGERCIPGDETHCGDEGPARDAKLAHPKGQYELFSPPFKCTLYHEYFVVRNLIMQ
jgi:hypothetical protein